MSHVENSLAERKVAHCHATSLSVTLFSHLKLFWKFVHQKYTGFTLMAAELLGYTAHYVIFAVRV